MDDIINQWNKEALKICKKEMGNCPNNNTLQSNQIDKHNIVSNECEKQILYCA